MIFIYEHFKTRKEARDRRAELEKKGFTCAIEKGNTTWTLAVGAPELFDPGCFHFSFNVIGNLMKIVPGLGKVSAARSYIRIVEAEIVNP